MKRRQPLFLAMAAVNAALALALDGWGRVACICAAVTCLMAYLGSKGGQR